MAKTFRLIDGYNLMHAAGLARTSYGPGELEKRRNRFLRWLVSRLSALERYTTTVVFDAQSAGHGFDHEDEQEGMTVLFAASNKDADTLIEELIAQHSAPRQIEVVSSDHRLHKAVRKRKGRAIDSEDFVKVLEKREVIQEKKSPNTPANQAESDVDMWLEEFGEIPEAKQLKSRPQNKDKDDQPDWIRKIEEEFGI